MTNDGPIPSDLYRPPPPASSPKYETFDLRRSDFEYDEDYARSLAESTAQDLTVEADQGRRHAAEPGIVVTPEPAQAKVQTFPPEVTVTQDPSVVVAVRLVEVVQHTTAIKEFVREYVTKNEPSEFEQAILAAVQVEVDEISDTIGNFLEESVSPAEVADEPKVRNAGIVINWLIGALKNVRDVAQLVNLLQGLLKVLGMSL